MNTTTPPADTTEVVSAAYAWLGKQADRRAAYGGPPTEAENHCAALIGAVTALTAPGQTARTTIDLMTITGMTLTEAQAAIGLPAELADVRAQLAVALTRVVDAEGALANALDTDHYPRHRRTLRQIADLVADHHDKPATGFNAIRTLLEEQAQS